MNGFRLWAGFFGAVLKAATAMGAAPQPREQPVWWVEAGAFTGWVEIKVEGGDVAKRQPKPRADGRWVKQGPHRGWMSPDGKWEVYAEDVLKKLKPGGKLEDVRVDLMVADAGGKNERRLIEGLPYKYHWDWSPDGNHVVCTADQGDGWHLYRVPHAGGDPVRLSGTASKHFKIPYHELPDGRVAYFIATGVEEVKFPENGMTPGSVNSYPVGDLVVSDGKRNRTVVENVREPAFDLSPDGGRLAYGGRSAAGPAVVVVEIETAKSHSIPVTEFNPTWACGVERIAFRPDGAALAVTFSVGTRFRRKGPLPGDDSEQHVGVLWLDGRANRTRVFRPELPPDKHKEFQRIDSIRWCRDQGVMK